MILLISRRPSKVYPTFSTRPTYLPYHAMSPMFPPPLNRSIPHPSIYPFILGTIWNINQSTLSLGTNQYLNNISIRFQS